jgi:hypothetical protein
MESEKVLYWMTLGVLAMATTTGFVTGHRGWGDRLADRSIAMVSQASERAMNYAEMASMVMGSGDRDSGRSLQTVIEVQNRLACVQRVLVRRQVEMSRLQAMRMQVRMLKQSPRTIVWPNPKLVIEVPQPPQVQVDTF